MRYKCDTCKHFVYSDERSVGAGWVPYCDKFHWECRGESEEKVEADTRYNSIWDSCKDYKSNK